jgi:hypothetical protein
MKKQLLTAILAITSFFAAAKPTKTELLVHLNNAQIAVENELQELAYEAKALEKNFSDYSVCKKILNELYDGPKFQQKYSNTAKLMLGLLSYKIRPIDTYVFVPVKDAWHNPVGDFFTLFPFDGSEEDKNIIQNLLAELTIATNIQENDEELICTPLNELVEKHCHKNDIRTLQEKMDRFFGSDESFDLCNIVVYTKTLTLLLQEIESKIQELQKA